ncbi:MAG: hypothetical protein KDG54_11175 [Geminicoccaceae bacterium]|nr:hypothetical protein [Geminicoccaceae bacterium]
MVMAVLAVWLRRVLRKVQCVAAMLFISACQTQAAPVKSPTATAIGAASSIRDKRVGHIVRAIPAGPFIALVITVTPDCTLRFWKFDTASGRLFPVLGDKAQSVLRTHLRQLTGITMECI